MRRFILTFFISTAAIISASGQLCYPEEVGYPGKAPWNIDGSVNDWIGLLGSYSGDPLFPYPSGLGKLNWTLDDLNSINGLCGSSDQDFPPLTNDLRFSGFVTDDYNLYFYLRRTTNVGDAQTVFYFLDVNADGFMKKGEPVLMITFNDNKVIKYKIGKYIENETQDYVAGKGNYMYQPSSQYIVDNYEIKGKVDDLFDTKHIPANLAMSSNEIFDAAITEDGFGLELSVPRKFIKNWDLEYATTFGLADMLTYHISNQAGAAPYNYTKVLDNMGACCRKLGVIGRPTASVVTHIITSIIPGQKYQVSLKLMNQSNVESLIRLPYIIVNNPSAVVKMYKDLNHDGQVTIGEPELTYQNIIGWYIALGGSSGISTMPGAVASFIFQIEFPSAVSQFSYSIQPSIENWYREACFPTSCGLGEGGRPINPIGFTVIIDDVTMRKPVEQTELVPGLLKIYPNPGNGNLSIVFPLSSEDYQVSLSDNLGKRMKIYDRVKSSMQITGLQNGVYFLQVTNMKTRVTETRKIIVQK